MQDIVQEALEHDEQEKDEFSDSVGFGNPRVVIVGCGGAGNNTVNRLYNIGVDGADTVAINTDKQHLKMIEADTKILVGKSLTNGRGAGGDPSIGERATEMAQGTIKEVLGDADLVFVTAGMGGGTGTGAAPVVSKIAKEQGAIVVGMVSTPFNVERARTVKAEEGLEKLREAADSIIVLDNNRLLDYVPNLPIGKAFSVMDQIIAETVKGISETITQPSLINLDYADITSILDRGGIGVMLVGETQDKNKTREVVNDAMNHPLLDVDYRGASGALVHITGGPDLTLKEAEGIADNITERLDASANVIWGARIHENYKGKVRVMAIMTGVDSERVMGASTQQQANRSREALEGSTEQAAPSEVSPDTSKAAATDGGSSGEDRETNNGIDVIR
ncbi:cell division protein FtsZ [Haloarchaeobius sp. TZWSO28]|uniref:cell division protein FtsZ n=1 Tax=Haloarchaeobius sp. TZWSO28 TaxID=3446119 RepID=UPI003EBA8794